LCFRKENGLRIPFGRLVIETLEGRMRHFLGDSGRPPDLIERSGVELELLAIELPDDRAPPIQAGRASSDQPTKAASGSTKAKTRPNLT